jgi:hypothetical protein
VQENSVLLETERRLLGRRLDESDAITRRRARRHSRWGSWSPRRSSGSPRRMTGPGGRQRGGLARRSGRGRRRRAQPRGAQERRRNRCGGIRRSRTRPILGPRTPAATAIKRFSISSRMRRGTRCCGARSQSVRETCSGKSARRGRFGFCVPVSPDHVHMLVVAPPQLAPAKLVQFLKGRSSRMLQGDCPQLRKRYWGNICGLQVPSVRRWARSTSRRSCNTSSRRNGIRPMKDSKSPRAEP